MREFTSDLIAAAKAKMLSEEPAIWRAWDWSSGGRIARMETIGKIYQANASLVVPDKIGNVAEMEGEPDYEMHLQVGSMMPILRSVQTGKWFALSWWDIAKLAVQAGIDTP